MRRTATASDPNEPAADASQPIPASARTALPRSLHDRVARLRYITGFITVADEHDPRAGLFARLWHVQRVASVAHLLGERHGDLDAAAAARLAWMHDLNRWPFAHNSEAGRFDQVANLEPYFAAEPEVTDADLADLKGIHRKDPASISDAARVVLLADTITGMIEDPLLAVIGLNVHPKLIPDSVNGLLGYSLAAGDLYRSCERMATAFHHTRRMSMEAFSAHFHEIFFDLVERFLSGHEGDLRQGYARMLAISQEVKDTVMRPLIFPLNNERVCDAWWLRTAVMPWYFARAKGSTDRLLEINEREFVAEATNDDAPFRLEQFRPDLDFVTRTMPDLAFVQSRTPIRPLSMS